MSKLKVFSPSFNSHRFAVNCIDSVASQTRLPDEHFYIDDCSTDDTLQWISKHHSRMMENASGKYNLQIAANQGQNSRKWKLLNLYEYVIKCDPEDIICVLDGDDWLASSDVLEKIEREYNEYNAKYVYTNWKYSHNNQSGISAKIPATDWNPYTSPWITSAMSTFKAGEFQKIPIANFLRWDFRWFTMGCDQAYVLPILHQIQRESKSFDSVRFINEELYVYQFIENPNKPRNNNDGGMRMDAHDSVTYIKNRGYLK